MPDRIETWQDVLARRREIGINLLAPLSSTDQQVLEYLLREEAEYRHLVQPPIVNHLMKFLEEKIS
jgi:hypothetical protein